MLKVTLLQKLHIMFKVELIQLQKKVSNKKQIHVLFDETTSLPCLYPFLFLKDELRFQSLSTQYADLSALKLWYLFWYQKYKTSFCLSFYKLRNYETYLTELENFIIFLEQKYKLEKNIFYIGADESIDYGRISANLSSIKKFLIYIIPKYFQFSEFENNIISKEELKERIDNINKKLGNISKNNPKDNNNKFFYKSMNSEMIKKMLEIINPSMENNKNPFHNKEYRFRNYLIVYLIYNYGLRVGELMLLTTSSFKKSIITLNNPKEETGRYSLIVINSEDDYDNRRRSPNIKNEDSKRIINLEIDDYELIKLYIDKIRKNTNTDILFTTLNSNNNEPLSYAAIYKLFEQIDSKMKEMVPHYFSDEYFDAIDKITPHVLRHTWAYMTLSYYYNKYLADKKEISNPLELAENELRELGGWSLKSEMPLHYGRRFLVEIANFRNLERIRKNRQG